jgi:hypothetical protein
MMADLADSKTKCKKRLDMSAGDMVCFEGDHLLRAGIGIVLSADSSRVDIYDSRGEDFFVLVHWVERGQAMWMRSREIAYLAI